MGAGIVGGCAVVGAALLAIETDVVDAALFRVGADVVDVVGFPAIGFPESDWGGDLNIFGSVEPLNISNLL